MYIMPYTHVHTNKQIHTHHTHLYLAQHERLTTIFKYPTTLPQMLHIK